MSVTALQQDDSAYVRFWNDVLAPKFIRFKHILVDGLRDFRFWHDSEVPTRLAYVCYRG